MVSQRRQQMRTVMMTRKEFDIEFNHMPSEFEYQIYKFGFLDAQVLNRDTTIKRLEDELNDKENKLDRLSGRLDKDNEESTY